MGAAGFAPKCRPSGPGPEGLGGMAELRALVPGGTGDTGISYLPTIVYMSDMDSLVLTTKWVHLSKLNKRMGPLVQIKQENGFTCPNQSREWVRLSKSNKSKGFTCPSQSRVHLHVYRNWICGFYHELHLWLLPPLVYAHRAHPTTSIQEGGGEGGGVIA